MERLRIFDLIPSQKMDDIAFCRNMLNLVWFFDNGLWREVVVSLQGQTRSGWQKYLYGSLMLKIILVALLNY